MTHYFVSDVHLHLKNLQPATRFANFVDRLGSQATLVIVGDLCDFWFSTREQKAYPGTCPGLNSLVQFRSRGGQLKLLAGNHDAWLEPFYQDRLDVGFEREPFQITRHNVTLHLLHGHLTGPTTRGKTLLATRLFHTAFSWLPGLLASQLNRLRMDSNERTHDTDCEKFMTAYRKYVSGVDGGEAQVFVFGHVHEMIDEMHDSRRIIVLGDWRKNINYLRLDASGLEFIVEP